MTWQVACTAPGAMAALLAIAWNRGIRGHTLGTRSWHSPLLGGLAYCWHKWFEVEGARVFPILDGCKDCKVVDQMSHECWPRVGLLVPGIALGFDVQNLSPAVLAGVDDGQRARGFVITIRSSLWTVAWIAWIQLAFFPAEQVVHFRKF